jgi:nucleoside-diphosphate-sugar epimerase
MAAQCHLVTGATGFIGGALVLELLGRTDAEILCVTRPKGKTTAEDRLRAALVRAARAYGQPGLGQAIMRRCRAVVGDVTHPGCVAEPLRRGRVSQVWHAAGSLLFKEDSADEVFRHNVAGTQNLLRLAQELAVPCFNHVSTAYVAGRRTGVIESAPPAEDVVANNCYERSKIAAERAVLAAGLDCVRVYRPSIVIGHSTTYEATTFTGLYGFIKAFIAVRAAIARTLGDFLAFRPLRLRADAGAHINFIPVDRVASAAVTVALSGGGQGIYHLANSCQPTLGESMCLLAQRLAIKPPVYVTDPGEFSLIDERVDERLEFYRSYLGGSKFFDLEPTQRLVGRDVLTVPLKPDVLGGYIDWYLDRHHRGGN